MMEFVEEPVEVETISKAEAGRRLKLARVAAGWRSAREAARAIGMAHSQYQQIEQGIVMPVWTTLLRAAIRLGLDPGILFPELVSEDAAHRPPTLGQIPLPPGVTLDQAGQRLAHLFAEDDGK
jgi:transcriptional regulator with XRE-family HTH domain